MDSENLPSLYDEVYELLEVRSKNDTQAEPYKSKYNAQKILEIMKSIISREQDKETLSSEPLSVNQCSELNAQLAAVYVLLGVVGVETDELSTGQENLEKCLIIMSEKELASNCISISIHCLNNLAILWAQRDEQEKALEYLVKARDLYIKYRNLDDTKPPMSTHELFKCTLPSRNLGGWEYFEKLHTLTLYYLAQVYGTLGKSNEAAHLLLATLHRQLSSEDYQSMTWAVNAANLSKYFQKHKKYKLARRVLAAAWTMIQSLDVPSIDVSVEQNVIDEQEIKEKFLECKAEICRNWGLYCVSLLQVSYDSVSEENEGLLDESQSSVSEEESLEEMEFCKLEISSIEEEVDCKIAKDYEDAKKLFMSGIRWLNDARNFYTLQDHASTHTEVSQEISTLYKLLASFDTAADRRSKMHKRRVDLLTPLLEELNSQYYLQVCRQLDYELGETYSAMVDCKYESIGNVTPNLHQASKINVLVKSGVKHFQNYLNSFIPPSGEIPKRYPEESERPVLVAYFHLGRLWSKLFVAGSEERVNNVVMSLENYKILVDYCENHPSSASLMELELPVCKEMVQLLPYKIERIRAYGTQT